MMQSELHYATQLQLCLPLSVGQRRNSPVGQKRRIKNGTDLRDKGRVNFSMLCSFNFSGTKPEQFMSQPAVSFPHVPSEVFSSRLGESRPKMVWLL
mmetsp:Transcript_16404/g.29134  ORF Transcript_16404/g.29134 Transcript_16404/m.29134 type:complete len:96 (-) Transcript_16404:1053-1340(-)